VTSFRLEEVGMDVLVLERSAADTLIDDMKDR
jgi:hypothetical protein